MTEMSHQEVTIYPVKTGRKANPWNKPNPRNSWPEPASRCSEGHPLQGTAYRVTCVRCGCYWERQE